MNPKKAFYLTLGFFFLALGVVGVFLPVLPTTPFILLAAFFFSRGSEKWHGWLLSNPTFGPSIRDWEDHRVIRLRAKILATVLMVISFSSLWVFVQAPLFGKLAMESVAFMVLIFIWSCPSHPKKGAMTTKNH